MKKVLTNMKRILIFVSAILFLLSLPRCNQEREVPDISGVKVRIDINRFERDIFEVYPDSIPNKLDNWRNTYGTFFPVFNQRVINIGSSYNPGYPEFLKTFITDYDMNMLYQEVNNVFPDVNNLENELGKAFSYYLYYFPDKKVPDIFTFISGLNESVITVDTVLAIALDKYLGMNEEIYKQAQIYNYLTYKMHPAKIPSDCARAWGMNQFEMDNPAATLLNHIIYEGKIMYFTKKLLPNEPDTLTWGFTPQQLKFCRNNEKQMWVYLVENDLLFKTDYATINKFTREGPFTKDFSNESPARAAVWIGNRIIEAFMRKNSDYDLKALMNENDHEKILRLSKYNP